MPVCQVCQNNFLISEAEVAFYEKVSPMIAGNKYLIPLPIFCPEHRLQRRWTFRNEHNLYNNTCSKSGKPVISMFPPTLPIQVWDQKLWWDNTWDGTEYGRDFDFSRPFFEQYAELLRSVPHPNLLNDATTNENSDYVNCTISLKNCYMITDAGTCEDCYYSNIINGSRNCVDCTTVVDCELGYDLVGCISCYHVQGLINCDNCRDSSFLYACKSCNDCFGCYNLRHKQYCWYNEQKTEAEFRKLKAELDLGNFEVYQKEKQKFLEFIKQAPREFAYLMNCESCTGNVLVRSHNTKNSFDSDKNQDSAYTLCTTNIRDSFDIEHTYNAELSLEVMAATDIYQNFFSFYTIHSQNIFYSYLACNSKNCFGCAGIKNQEYCILNKKYTKEEYENLVPKIIAHMIKEQSWGIFFPMSVSLHGYNESLAADYFPLTKAEAQALGANWCEYEIPKPEVTKVLTAESLPAHIRDISDEILNQVIVCAESGKLFRITKQELQFYREQNLPLPRTCPDIRYQKRLHIRLPRKLWQRQCDCTGCATHQAQCTTHFETPYAPERVEKVYCSECYQRLVG